MKGTYHRRALTVEQRIESMLAPPDVRGCRVWLGQRLNHLGTRPEGYGQIKISGVRRRVNRVIWELHNGPLLPGDLVCHTCDNPPCCTLAHLFKSDAAGNMADKVAKRRQATAHLKLTVHQAREVLRYRSKGWSLGQISKKYGVSPQAISFIVRGVHFKYLQEPQ